MAAALGLIAALSFATPARADAWRPVPQSCVSSTGTGGACTLVRAAGGLWRVVVAPGGQHAYGIAYNDNALLIFDRNPATGKLTQRGAGGCLSETGSGGACTKAKGLSTPGAMVISPDGRQVYVASQGPGTVATFDRNTVSGDLSQKPGPTSCISQDGSSGGTAGVCTDGRGLSLAGALVLSPDGRQLYAGTQPIAILQRNPSTGVLTQPAGEAGCVDENQADGCADGHGLKISRQAAVTPDGRSVYMPGNDLNTLTIFDRNPATGLIRQKAGTAGCMGLTSLGGQCAVDPKLARVLAIIPAPDSRHVYVSVVDGIVTYRRAADGRLTLQSCINATGSGGCVEGKQLRLVSYSAMSPDGQTIVAGLEQDPGIVLFERDAASGNLRQVPGADACVTPDGSALVRGALVANRCRRQPAVLADGQMTFVNDGSFIAGAYIGGGLISFKRDFYPFCGGVGVAVTQGVAGTVPLSCSDRNRDRLTYAITAAPASGVLGAIDQAHASVFYSPFAGFTGTDRFRYRAIAAGLQSAEATATMTVAAPPAAPRGPENPPPPPPPPGPGTVDSPVPYNWSVRGSRLTLRQLVARDLPASATVTLRCSGKRCPFKIKTIKRGRSSTLDLMRSLKGKRTFRAGQTLEVHVAAPGLNTKVLRFKLKRGKVPKHTTHCIPLGATKVQRSC